MRIISIILFVFSYSLVIGQDGSTIPAKWKKYLYDYKVTLTKVDFYVNDTIIPYTLIQEPNGSYSFIEGHQFTADSVTFDYQTVYHTVKEPQKDTLIRNVIFVKKNEVLKLNDLVSHFSLKNGGFLNTYDTDFQFYSYIHELHYSFIFNQIGLIQLSEMDNDSIIRLTNYKTSPLSSKAPQVTIYKLTSTFKQIEKMCYSIDSNHNFVLEKKEIIPLKKNEIKYLDKSFQLSLKEDIKFSTKTKQYNPFLLEFKKGDDVRIIERSDGADSDERNLNPHDYHSKFQDFVSLVNYYGKTSSRKIHIRNRKLNK